MVIEVNALTISAAVYMAVNFGICGWLVSSSRRPNSFTEGFQNGFVLGGVLFVGVPILLTAAIFRHGTELYHNLHVRDLFLLYFTKRYDSLSKGDLELINTWALGGDNKLDVSVRAWIADRVNARNGYEIDFYIRRK